MTDLRDFIGSRVELDVRDETVSGILKFVTPGGKVVVAGPGGHETWRDVSAVTDARDIRRACDKPDCGRHNNTFVTDDGQELCADHYRTWAYDQPAPIMPCPECNTGAQAFYSPGRKKFACPACHGIGGGLTGLGAEARFLAVQNADCRAQPADDPRHEWVHVRGHRWHCRLCEAKRFTDPPLDHVVRRG